MRTLRRDLKHFTAPSSDADHSLLSSTRRDFVRGAGLAAGGLLLTSFSSWRALQAAEPGPSPFTLGVASGDPTESTVVLWTRLAPDPLHGGGMPFGPVNVRWEIATDSAMRTIVKRGASVALDQLGHSVHAFVTGLEPDRWYWYRFDALGASSEVGRTRTFPAPGSDVAKLRFALVSCQDYEAGYYAAYRDMAQQDLDFVVHVGDYIYEYGATENPLAPRRHLGGEIRSLQDYRNRYALYKLDPNLRAAHAAFPFILTWDDHEVENNYAGDTPEIDPNDPQTIAEFLARRARGYQAYVEHQPIQPEALVVGPETPIYRRLNFGTLAEFNVLDTRRYRTDQPCGDGLQLLCAGALSPAATLTGGEQEQWLFDGLRSSQSLWNVMAQQVMMTKWDLGVLVGRPGFFNMDAWDGYPAARKRMMDFLARVRPSNPVVLTGDIHSSWAADLKQDFGDRAAAPVGTEFVCTSISSVFGDDNDRLVRFTLPSNPHIKYFDGLKRGYALCTVDRELWSTEFRAVADILDPESAVTTQARFGTEAGRPGAIRL